MSLYNSGERGFKTRVWPALYPTKTQSVGYGDKLAKIIAEEKDKEGKPTDPQRFNEIDLMERLVRMVEVVLICSSCHNIE